jgi:hypothetical protein
LTEPEGSEGWFRRSVTFGVEREGTGRGEHSHLTAEDDVLAMASAIRQAAGADVGVGVGAIVVADDSTPGRPYGEVHVAVNVHGRETKRRLSFNGDRARVREWAADAALALLRFWLLEYEEGSQSGGTSAMLRRQA